MHRHDYLLGCVIGFAFGCFMAAIYWPVSDEPPQDGVEPPRFEVVDRYDGCKVVRYTAKGEAKYHYFLDCGSFK
jgi:hypothetical protein